MYKNIFDRELLVQKKLRLAEVMTKRARMAAGTSPSRQDANLEELKPFADSVVDPSDAKRSQLQEPSKEQPKKKRKKAEIKLDDQRLCKMMEQSSVEQKHPLFDFSIPSFH